MILICVYTPKGFYNDIIISKIKELRSFAIDDKFELFYHCYLFKIKKEDWKSIVTICFQLGLEFFTIKKEDWLFFGFE